MRRASITTIALIFLATGLIPARTLHYCRMLDRATTGDCGVCAARAVDQHQPASCCSINPESKVDEPVRDADPECCSLVVQEPFAAAASGTLDGVATSPPSHDAPLLASTIATHVQSQVVLPAGFSPNIVDPTIATPPACLAGSGFLS